jgi:hypothetical protein
VRKVREAALAAETWLVADRKGGDQSLASLQKGAEQAEQAAEAEQAAVALFGVQAGRHEWVDATGWASPSADDPSPCPDRYGVDVDDKARLVGLRLSGNQLRGALSNVANALFKAATRLVVLDLRCNELAGPIPPSIGHLGCLTELYLALNRLEGPIPDEIGALGRLRKLGLNGNRLSGPVPTALTRLKNLVLLDLSSNDRLAVPKGTSLDCPSQKRIADLYDALGF